MSSITFSSAILHGVSARVLRFFSTEALSHDFEYCLELETERKLSAQAMTGTLLTLSVTNNLGNGREYSGFITRLTDQGILRGKYCYRLTLNSGLVFLQKNRDCRIFQDVDILTVIQTLFSRYPALNFRCELKNRYPRRAYCVQYLESDFAFIHRLLEDEGLYYTFHHAAGGHTLIITDQPQLFPEQSPLPVDYIADSEEERAIREGIQCLSQDFCLASNEVQLRDFDYLVPGKDLHVAAAAPVNPAIPPLRWFDYAAGYADSAQGERLARIRLEEIESHARQLQADGNVLGLMPGQTVRLQQHPDTEKNRCYIITACQYRCTQGEADSRSQGSNVQCQLTLIEDDVQYRPVRKTPRPRPPGVQSAIVVGPPDAEIYTDQHARIKVHFHWDRYTTSEENSSCWIRVAQSWAGKGWGMLALPRVGQEVLITCVDGDIDRPLVTGMVYNGDNPPPWKLPDHIHRSGIVSRSLQQGTLHHANHFTFEDKRGEEKIVLHAERDLHETVERNRYCHIQGERATRVNRAAYDWFSDHYIFTDCVYTVNGCSTTFTGISRAMTGVSLNLTGLQYGFVVSNSNLIGLNNSVVNINNGVTAVNNLFTGIQTMFMGEASHFIGVLNEAKPVANFLTGVINSATENSNSITDISNNAIRQNNVLAGSSNFFAGVTNSTVGSAYSVTGSAVNMTGNSVSQTGNAISTTGSSISNTGLAVSNTRLAISQTDVSVTSVGVQMKN